ncbi:glycosyltransferase family 2 protein [Wenjunlia tyrosinilytica]|uniref:Glycosyltransferase n=1 Tax=Wenjunlia tyrosinilytica TaxID=1544741 RepID=A0A917ZVL5_9ACTN|nr:galactosyltransferase-related protein [Wenjunlia tyrosinilytica]GGO96019.1 hypothetical protein GCM10012280_54580 [Wenjunlia tyrosinilytica]
MSWTDPSPRILAEVVVSSLVIAADPFAQSTAPGFWTWSRDAHQSVVDEVAASPHARVRELAAAIRANPSDFAACSELGTLLEAGLREPGLSAERLAELTWNVETLSRLRLQLGEERTPSADTAPGPQKILANLRHAPARSTGRIDAAIVVPFRATEVDSDRIRNVCAVLSALNDQTHPRDRYRVVVVESDSCPRWEPLLAPACDTYLFASNDGPFNYSWTINTGVVHGARPAELICVLEADILVDEGFVERAVTRFRAPGTQAHWPFQDMLYLDAASSHEAVITRCIEDGRGLSHSRLRGVFLRRTPGACMWLRESLFTRIGGLDERFSAGWGGADNDFAWRADMYGVLDRHQDPMVHLYHSRTSDWFDDNVGRYNDFPWCTWPSDSVIGELSKYQNAQ